MKRLLRLATTAVLLAAVLGAATPPADATGAAGATGTPAPDRDPAAYADVLDLHGTPAAALPGDGSGDTDDNPITVFADQGAWHAYALPAPGDTASYGGFTGPLYLAHEYPWWLSTSFTRIQLSEQGRPLDLAGGGAPVLSSLPGRLLERYDLGQGLRLTLELRFTDDRTALVRASVENQGPGPRTLGVGWTGALLRPAEEPMRDAPGLVATGTGVAVDFARVQQTYDYLSDGTERFEVTHDRPVSTTVSGDSYRTEQSAPLDLAPGARQQLSWTESYTFTLAERAQEQAAARHLLARPATVAAAADAVDARWRGYLAAATARVPADRRRLAVKAVETLTTNWRSPAGALRHATITPSISNKWFAGGAWAWDTWKQAVGTVVFDPGLAESQIRAMFDYQVRPGDPAYPNDAGMIPDCVFYTDPAHGGGNWNQRNSKPPLAAWAVWQVFQATGDTAFLAELYPELTAYQQWWARDRDHDGDGVAEYGATVDPGNATTEDIRQAAAWESGMDDAPRFDAALGTAPVANHDAAGTLTGYSLNQESVDLNSYLAADRHYLALIAARLGHPADAAGWSASSAALAARVRERMYDPATGWFYDTALGSGTRLVDRGRGAEGITPLWTGVASPAQAAAVRAALTDPNGFGTPTPFPSVAKSSPFFDPTGYWRGSVWLDQAYFALTGLRRYGYGADASALTERLLSTAQGLTGDQPIRENYDPLTGAGLNSRNFSWSAALLLPLLSDAD
ncbi:trehalase family glycosidase [Kitasatospora sp. NBC_01287]|uniref:MGH1-like glycoside hydrolase domain-containing protein n=1 Tax=Kitasatospora sp. NBC_01287 TaxID=2903573 RepID=UPI002252232C|nr:trehalase family glycosidase [Kitasatospora sp. NBC_01287]MCX4745748.1 trehalase family glycosidase [Kitasatospora sp. NBC_01287]